MSDNKDGRYNKPVNHTVIPKLQPPNERFIIILGHQLRYVWQHGRYVPQTSYPHVIPKLQPSDEWYTDYQGHQLHVWQQGR